MYLIDGHNLIGSGSLPGVSLDQEGDEERLVAYLRARQPALRQTMTVIFDAGIPGGFSSSLSGGGVTVSFAPSGQAEADGIILTRVRKYTGKTPLTVVSNDGRLLAEVSALGGIAMRPAAFIEKLNAPRRSPRHFQSAPDASEKPKPTRAENEEWLSLFDEAARKRK